VYFHQGVKELAWPIPESAARPDLHPEEIRVVTDLLRPNVSPPTSLQGPDFIVWRDWVIWILLRFSGIRAGELLKLKVCGFPTRETPALRIAREFDQQANTIARQVGMTLQFRVPRYPDDPGDDRSVEPGTKRGSRSVPIGDEPIGVVWDFVEALNLNGFLIRAEGGAPLSVAGLYSRFHKIRLEAAQLYESRMGSASSALLQLTPHLLRHRRAKEMLRLVFPDGQENSMRTAFFKRYFGWKSERSAEPYLRILHQEDADHVLRGIQYEAIDSVRNLRES
jgi:integrase